tara:strand:- start:674 stop:1306 length:633 start_codon:yes stop_codon:yes gene_type:complete
MLKITIINYFQGNLSSIKNCVSQNFKNYKLNITNSIKDLKKADIIILPGVGRFSTGIKSLKKLGLFDYLKNLPSNKLLIGICLGMQILTKKSEEDPDCQGLGLIDAETKKFDLKKVGKIPKIGASETYVSKNYKNFSRFDKKNFFFTHSFYVSLNKSEQNHLLFKTKYNNFHFCSGFIKKNVIGVQFHPELSRNNGSLLYKSLFDLKKKY